MKNIWLAITILITLILTSTQSLAFSELIRHGYTSCTTCHFNPQGGGLMTPYGRSLSKEILSTWSYEREEEWLHGALPEGSQEKVEKWLHLGGDVRGIQIHTENSQTKQGQVFWMQKAVNVGLKYDQVMAMASLGKIENPMNQANEYFYGTTYWLMYDFKNDLTAKTGRLNPTFGINLPDHNVNIKANLQLGPGQEKDGISLNYSGKNWQWNAELLQSLPSQNRSSVENILTAQLQKIILERSKVGASFWFAEQSNQDKKQYQGLHGIFSFNDHSYWMIELDRKEEITTTVSRRGGFLFNRYGYEFYQGIHGLIQLQNSQTNLNDGTTRTDKGGLGVLMYPRPHWEISGIWNRVHMLTNNEWSDEANAILHYYF